MKDMIEKAERGTAKDVAKGLHSATKALSRAQKALSENNEAKKQHKAQWAKHAGEAIRTWQAQLHEFRDQQAVFQEISNKAMNDTDSVRNTIQTLNARAASTGVAATPLAPTSTLESDDTVTELDKENLIEAG